MSGINQSFRRISTEGSGATLEELLADPESPFLALDTPMTGYEWLKLCISPPVILIRSILVILILPPVWLYLLLLTYHLPLNKPLPRYAIRTRDQATIMKHPLVSLVTCL